MASTPRDRFDDIPDDLVRVGAHRAPARRGRGWINFAWAALATGVLIVGGLYGLSRVNPAISFELPVLGEDGGIAQPEVTEAPRPEVDPVTDPSTVDPSLSVSISVLNGSPTDGQQNAAVAQLTQAGWGPPTFPPIAGAVAGSRETELSGIYYNGAQYEGVALGIAQLLGIDPANLRNSDFYLGASITILLGADYTPAG